MPGFGGMGGKVGESGPGTKMKGMGGGKAKPPKPSPTFEELEEQFAPKAIPLSYHKGGRVKKGGYAKVKKNEVVLTVAQQKSVGIKKRGKKKTRTRKVAATKR
jgi:hypothetical protein